MTELFDEALTRAILARKADTNRGVADGKDVARLRPYLERELAARGLEIVRRGV